MALSSYHDLLIQIARLTEAYIESTPTSNVSVLQTQLTDTKLKTINRGFADDEFNGGTLLAPTEALVVSDFDGASGIITIDGSFGASFTTAKQYLILSNRYPLAQVRAALAGAMADLPARVYTDESLTTTADTLVYTLNTASRPQAQVLEVWVATQDASPYYYQRALGVKARPDEALTGLSILLEFPYQPVVGRKIKVVYTLPAGYGAETFLDDPSSDTVTAHLLAYVPWLILDSTVRLIRWRTQQAGADTERLMPLLNDLMTRAIKTRMGLGIKRHQLQPLFPFTEIS